MCQKSGVSSCWSSQEFPVLQPQIVCFALWLVWRNSLQKAFKVNEAKGISRMSPDPLLSGGVWARDYFPSASEDMYMFGNRMHGVLLKPVYYVMNINGYIRCLQRASTDLKPATQLHFVHEVAVPISRSSQHRWWDLVLAETHLAHHLGLFLF